MTTIKTFLIDGIVVEATLSPGGGFYDVRVPETDAKFRCVAWAFDSIAVPYLNISDWEIKDEV